MGELTDDSNANLDNFNVSDDAACQGRIFQIKANPALPNQVAPNLRRATAPGIAASEPSDGR